MLAVQQDGDQKHTKIRVKYLVNAANPAEVFAEQSTLCKRVQESYKARSLLGKEWAEILWNKMWKTLCCLQKYIYKTIIAKGDVTKHRMPKDLVWACFHCLFEA